MKRFIAQHASKITGILSGFDRLVFRGTLRKIAYLQGMQLFLDFRHVLLKNFAPFVLWASTRVKESSLEAARRSGRPVLYVASSRANKEEVARQVAQKDSIRDGLVAILTSVEAGASYDIYKNRRTKMLDLVARERRCLHLYHYGLDPDFGWMHARIQTWFPFNVQIYVNGREWLARAMTREGLSFRQQDNCFTWIEKPDRAQKLMDRLLQTDWKGRLDRIAHRLNPAHAEIFQKFEVDYYWSTYQSEWATDLMFREAGDLAAIYPPLVRHAMLGLQSPDVLRFLSHKVNNGHFEGQITGDFKDRPEGVRVKHAIDGNSVKMYDKQGSVLRVETTMGNPRVFKVWRRKSPDRTKAWRPMRKGISDLYRLTRVADAANRRYLEALAAADTATPLGTLVASVANPVEWNGQRVRGFRAWDTEDLALLTAVSRGEFALNGFRNRDLQPLLGATVSDSPKEHRRLSARVSRHLRLLRAHGLIRKIPRTHRYLLTPKGTEMAAVLLTAQTVTPQQLHKALA